MNFKRAILLVREPHKAILAEFNRQNSGHIGVAPKNLFNDYKFEEFVFEKLTSWKAMNVAWARKFPKPLKIVFYSDLLNFLQKTLRDILNFLEWPVNESTLSCAIRKQKGYFKRKRNSFDPYSKKLKNILIKAQREVFDELKMIQMKSLKEH